MRVDEALFGHVSTEQFSRWHIVYVGQSVAILESLAGSLITVTSPAQGVVPMGMSFTDATAANRWLRSLREQTSVCEPWWSQAGDLAEVDLSIPALAPDPESVAQWVGILASGQATANNLMDSAPQRAMATPFVATVLSGEPDDQVAVIRPLLGAGPGSTPAGDDVMVGALAVLHAWAKQASDPTVARGLAALRGGLRPLLSQTTATSAIQLEAALDGRFAERVQTLAQSFAGITAVDASAEAARTWGSTSGLDLAAGMRAACERLLAPRHAEFVDPPHDGRSL